MDDFGTYIITDVINDLNWWLRALDPNNPVQMSRKILYFEKLGRSCLWEPRIINNWNVLSQEFLSAPENKDRFTVITSDASSRGYGWKAGEKEGSGHWSTWERKRHINLLETKGLRIAI